MAKEISQLAGEHTLYVETWVWSLALYDCPRTAKSNLSQEM